MAQTIYGLTTDYGDGTNGVRWFKDKARVDELLEISSAGDGYEEYYGNEGSPAATLTFPDDLDLEACGFHFSSGV